MAKQSDMWGVVPIPARVAERAALRYLVVGECRVSTYSTVKGGYAKVGWSENSVEHTTLAHRAAWTFYNGPIPVGMTVDHQPPCQHTACVDEAHLRLLTNFENSRRRGGKDWPVGTCINGHSDAEYGVNWPSQRACRRCRVEHTQDYRARKRLVT